MGIGPAERAWCTQIFFSLKLQPKLAQISHPPKPKILATSLCIVRLWQTYQMVAAVVGLQDKYNINSWALFITAFPLIGTSFEILVFSIIENSHKM